MWQKNCVARLANVDQVFKKGAGPSVTAKAGWTSCTETKVEGAITWNNIYNASKLQPSLAGNSLCSSALANWDSLCLSRWARHFCLNSPNVQRFCTATKARGTFQELHQPWRQKRQEKQLPDQSTTNLKHKFAHVC